MDEREKQYLMSLTSCLMRVTEIQLEMTKRLERTEEFNWAQWERTNASLVGLDKRIRLLESVTNEVGR